MKWLTILSLIFLFSCKESKTDRITMTDQPVQVDTVPGSCPYLTKDTKGNLVLSWAREINDSVSAFCYAVSGDNGHSFSKPIVIPGSSQLDPHSENLPKIIFKPSGEIIAFWGESNANPK